MRGFYRKDCYEGYVDYCSRRRRFGNRCRPGFISGRFSRPHLRSRPTVAIRRQVSLCEAVYDGQTVVENMTCRRCRSIDELSTVWGRQEIPLLVDPEGKAIQMLHPWAVVDAILAKKNLGTNREMLAIPCLRSGVTALVDR
mgnify:CR=1 FL=1